MKVQKKLFTFQDSWPWLLLVLVACTFSLLAGLFGVRGPGFATKFEITLLVSAVIFGITIYRYLLRYSFIAAWNSAYQTSQGTAVLYETGLQPIANNIDIDHVVDLSCTFWNRYQNPSDEQLARLKGAFSGATICVVSKPIKVAFSDKVMGLQIGQNIGVVFDGVKVKTAHDFLQLVKHEVSHLCLTVMGIDPGYGGAAHHTIMLATGFC